MDRAGRALPLGRPGVLLGVPVALCCQLAAAAPAHPASRGRRAPRPGRPAPRPAGVRQGRHLPLQGARGRHLAEPVRARPGGRGRARWRRWGWGRRRGRWRRSGPGLHRRAGDPGHAPRNHRRPGRRPRRSEWRCRWWGRCGGRHSAPGRTRWRGDSGVRRREAPQWRGHLRPRSQRFCDRRILRGGDGGVSGGAGRGGGGGTGGSSGGAGAGTAAHRRPARTTSRVPVAAAPGAPL